MKNSKSFIGFIESFLTLLMFLAVIGKASVYTETTQAQTSSNFTKFKACPLTSKDPGSWIVASFTSNIDVNFSKYGCPISNEVIPSNQKPYQVYENGICFAFSGIYSPTKAFIPMPCSAVPGYNNSLNFTSCKNSSKDPGSWIAASYIAHANSYFPTYGCPIAGEVINSPNHPYQILSSGTKCMGFTGVFNKTTAFAPMDCSSIPGFKSTVVTTPTPPPAPPPTIAKPKILFVLGGNMNQSQWQSLANYIQQYYNSNGIPGTFTFYHFTDDIASAINAVPTSQSILLLGHSFGGDAAIEGATKASRKIEHLILFDPVSRAACCVPNAHLANIPSNVVEAVDFYRSATEAPYSYGIMQGKNLLDYTLPSFADVSNAGSSAQHGYMVWDLRALAYVKKAANGQNFLGP